MQSKRIVWTSGANLERGLTPLGAPGQGRARPWYILGPVRARAGAPRSVFAVGVSGWAISQTRVSFCKLSSRLAVPRVCCSFEFQLGRI